MLGYGIGIGGAGGAGVRHTSGNPVSMPPAWVFANMVASFSSPDVNLFAVHLDQLARPGQDIFAAQADLLLGAIVHPSRAQLIELRYLAIAALRRLKQPLANRFHVVRHETRAFNLSQERAGERRQRSEDHPSFGIPDAQLRAYDRDALLGAQS